MTKHFLYGAQIAGRLENVGSKGMAQDMRMDANRLIPNAFACDFSLNWTVLGDIRRPLELMKRAFVCSCCKDGSINVSRVSNQFLMA